MSEWMAFFRIDGERRVAEDLKAAALANLKARKRNRKNIKVRR